MALDAELREILRRSCASLGSTFTSKGGSKVLAEQTNRMLFAKVGPKAQVLGEAESLNAMYHASLKAGHGEGQTLIPTVHAFGETDDKRRAFLVTDYKDLSGRLNPAAQRTLGTKLAQMHLSGTSENGKYGFARATHCGATEQDNTWTDAWPEFWAERRIGDLVRRSGDRELAALEQQLREKVYPLVFCQEAMKDVRPAIIHGDLWSGNSGLDAASGEPIIFDPSSSYSHNEAELGIMKMFGGYSSDFFNAYHAVIPKAQPYYQQRQELYEAYHHLNHFVIFGGGYRSGTVRIFKNLIAWADEEWQKGGPPSTGGDDGNDGAGGSGHGRGLRGGNSSTSASHGNYGVGSSSCGYGSLSYGGSEPPAPGAAPFAMAASEGSHFAQQLEHLQNTNNLPSYPLKTAAPAPPVALPLAPTPSQIADFFSQMICYIWYSDRSPAQTRPSTPARSPTCRARTSHMSPRTTRWPMTANAYPGAPHRSSVLGTRRTHAKTTSTGGLPTSPARDAEMSRAMQSDLLASAASSPVATDVNVSSLASEPSMLRLQPKGRFLRFTRDLLATTQVSTSVITLALIYVARLKALHPKMKGREGSEYPLAISSLMLANKILDDNTYLNKTWAEISDMPLLEISKMETEFWLGLKMELHISKADYDAGLGDLQTLANSRAQAIREREALLKRAAMQQQSQFLQQQQRQLLHQRRMSKPNIGQEQNASTCRQGTPYAAPQWSVSSECLFPPHAQNASWRMHVPGRHSAGSIEMATPYVDHSYMPTTNNMASHNMTSEMQSPEHSLTHLSNPSPEYGNSLTVASSPMSPGSNAPSLAMTSNEALVCSDGEARTPQDFFVPGHHIDATGRMQHYDHAYEGFPGTATAEGAAYHIDAAMHHFSSGSAQQAQSAVPGHKRDYDRANMGSTSPNDTRGFKRFAYDAGHQQLDGARQYQQGSIAQGMQHSAFSPTAMRQSFNASTSTYAQHNDADVIYHGMNTAVQSPSVLMQASSRQPSPHHQYGQHQTQQYSAFATAMTPTSLVAPLTSASGNQHLPTLKSHGPLQYYSLAAGEPRGVLGTYNPPTSYAHGYAMGPTSASAQQYYPSLAGPSTSSFLPQALHTTVSPKSANAAWQPQPQPQVYAEQRPASLHYTTSEPMLSGRLSTLSHAPGAATWSSGNAGALSVAPSCMPGSSTPYTTSMPQGPEQSYMTLSHAQATPMTATTQQQQPHYSQHFGGQAPPPFALDVNAWPLMGSSTTPSYLFPYHLMPPMTATNSTSTRPISG